MATAYRTPGVYVEEIPKLPPSVAQVETAIPAFIGYTERAEKNGESLFLKAKTVQSLTEFEAYYGAGPPTTYEANLDSTDKVTSVTTSAPYCMYEALKLFFDNGGGKCYIIAVAAYKTAGTLVEDATLKSGLPVLEKEDEPTLIVCPDATRLSSNGLYDFQKLALAQAAKLGDRFVLCDTLPSDELTANQTLVDRVQAFRDNIGISNLKYGAAYVPYVRSSIPRIIRFRDLVLKQGGSTIGPESLTSDNATLQLIHDLKNAKTAVDSLANVQKNGGGLVTGTNKTIEDQLKALSNAVSGATTDPARITAVKDLYVFLVKTVAALKTIKDALPTKVATTPPTATSSQTVAFLLGGDLASLGATTGAADALRSLGAHSNAFGEGTATDELVTDDPTTATTDLAKALDVLGVPAADWNAAPAATVTALYQDPVTDAQKVTNALREAATEMGKLLRYFSAVTAAAASYEKTFDETLEGGFGLYKQIKAAVASQAAVLPPSAAIAGVYARVDSARGVWKAPANESLNSVFGPVVQISADEQGSMNIDTVAGKSINAIRTFTGKGTLVWGARTLAGNDNEWRYVNVRRFFNMVEESSKKATEPFVFESNDANTWVKVQGMLENFLIVMWRQGALQGAKPEHAFYVAVGLSKTMTALDILEGRMIVEIGMAVVRPAEFIILRFSHKMAES